MSAALDQLLAAAQQESGECSVFGERGRVFGGCGHGWQIGRCQCLLRALRLLAAISSEPDLLEGDLDP
jgi:hypothetical protein